MDFYSHLKVESNGLPEVTPAATGRQSWGAGVLTPVILCTCGDNEWHLVYFYAPCSFVKISPSLQA